MTTRRTYGPLVPSRNPELRKDFVRPSYVEGRPNHWPFWMYWEQGSYEVAHLTVDDVQFCINAFGEPPPNRSTATAEDAEDAERFENFRYAMFAFHTFDGYAWASRKHPGAKQNTQLLWAIAQRVALIGGRALSGGAFASDAEERLVLYTSISELRAYMFFCQRASSHSGVPILKVSPGLRIVTRAMLRMLKAQKHEFYDELIEPDHSE